MTTTTVEELDTRTPGVTAAVHAVLLVLRASYPDARWSLTCTLDRQECVLAIYDDIPNAWRVRDLVWVQLEEARTNEGVSVVLVVQPRAVANLPGTVTYPI